MTTKAFLLLLSAFILLPLNLRADNEAKKDITVLITGANRGLGLEMVKQFAADGYKVIGTARKPEKATDLKATGATIVKLDVTSEEDIAAMAKTLKGQKIDILINNAGYFGPKLMTENPDNITKLTRQEMTTCINVNTLGPIFVTQALLPNLRLSPMKKVVNISTRAASPGGTAYGYRISKTALNMVTRCMSVDAGMRGLIVIALAPGHNKTDMGTRLANLDPVQSMKKVKALIESLTPKHHGKLWFYDGSPMRW